MKKARKPAQRNRHEFDLEQFLPYLLNQAAEATSRSFEQIYSSRYGMTRTQWRVMANLGKFGAMTAKDICKISHIEKTKVSRAIVAMAESGFLTKQVSSTDRRAENLLLTARGMRTFNELGQRALDHDRQLRGRLDSEFSKTLVLVLQGLASR